LGWHCLLAPRSAWRLACHEMLSLLSGALGGGAADPAHPTAYAQALALTEVALHRDWRRVRRRGN
jgi:hypothetical protein